MSRANTPESFMLRARLATNFERYFESGTDVYARSEPEDSVSQAA